MLLGGTSGFVVVCSGGSYVDRFEPCVVVYPEIVMSC